MSFRAFVSGFVNRRSRVRVLHPAPSKSLKCRVNIYGHATQKASRDREQKGEIPTVRDSKSRNSPEAPVCGVYLLFQDEQLTYVGRSRDCATRIAAHRSNGRLFDSRVVIPCSPDQSIWIERAIVTATEPVQNRVLFTSHRRRAELRPLAPALGPSEHPLMILNKSAARRRVKAFGLAEEFEEAVRCGELAFRKKNPSSLNPHAESVVSLGNLIAWCERTRVNRARR